MKLLTKFWIAEVLLDLNVRGTNLKSNSVIQNFQVNQFVLIASCIVNLEGRDIDCLVILNVDLDIITVLNKDGYKHHFKINSIYFKQPLEIFQKLNKCFEALRINESNERK